MFGRPIVISGRSIVLMKRQQKRFEPSMSSDFRELLLHNWSKAVNMIQN